MTRLWNRVTLLGCACSFWSGDVPLPLHFIPSAGIIGNTLTGDSATSDSDRDTGTWYHGILNLYKLIHLHSTCFLKKLCNTEVFFTLYLLLKCSVGNEKQCCSITTRSYVSKVGILQEKTWANLERGNLTKNFVS